VVQQAYVEGVSTRKVDDLLKALGLTGIDKSKVSRICKELDDGSGAISQPPAGRRISLPVAGRPVPESAPEPSHRQSGDGDCHRCGHEGRRHNLGFALGASEESAFWLDFLRSLVERGLKGVQLVISDAHEA